MFREVRHFVTSKAKEIIIYLFKFVNFLPPGIGFPSVIGGRWMPLLFGAEGLEEFRADDNLKYN